MTLGARGASLRIYDVHVSKAIIMICILYIDCYVARPALTASEAWKAYTNNHFAIRLG